MPNENEKPLRENRCHLHGTMESGGEIVNSASGALNHGQHSRLQITRHFTFDRLLHRLASDVLGRGLGEDEIVRKSDKEIDKNRQKDSQTYR